MELEGEDTTELEEDAELGRCVVDDDMDEGTTVEDDALVDEIELDDLTDVASVDNF
jgi:hypothetical protein